MSDAPRILRDGEGDLMGPPAGCTDRFMIEGADTGGRFSLVEHTIAPGVIAAPMHRHTKEDEFTFVRSGVFAAILGDVEVTAYPGDLVFKPRNQWHTFWNPGDEPTRVLEIISPSGLEQFFRLVDVPEVQQDIPAIRKMSAEIGVDVDEEATKALVERLGVKF